MALIECPECARQISDVASQCPGCGYPPGSADLRPGPPPTAAPPVVLASKSGSVGSIKGELESENGMLRVRKRRDTKTLGALSQVASVKFPLRGDHSAELVFAGGDTWRLSTSKGGLLEFFEALAPEKIERSASKSKSYAGRVVGLGCLSFVVWTIVAAATTAAPNFFWVVCVALLFLVASLLVGEPPALRSFVAKRPGASALMAAAVAMGGLIGFGAAEQNETGTTTEVVYSEPAALEAALPATIEVTEEVVPTEAASPNVVPQATIPTDLQVDVRTMDLIPGLKRSLDVRLSRAVPEDVLRALAIQLRDSDPSKYESTFILYLLPGMTLGEGAWATTHFTPDLEVIIHGFTGEEDLADVDDVPGKVVGTWLKEGAGAHTLVIYRKGKATFTRTRFKNGTSIDSRVKETRTAQGRRFVEKGNSFGEYYLLVADGNLESWDRDGLIWTLTAVEM